MNGANVIAPGLTSPGAQMDIVKEGTIGIFLHIIQLQFMEKVNNMLWQLELQKCQQKICQICYIFIYFRKTINKDIAIEIWHSLGDGLWNLRELKK